VIRDALPLLLALVAAAPGCGDDVSDPDADASADGEAEAEANDADEVGDAGDAGEACDTCHGGAGQPAPPPDLAGGTDRTARGVGAHAAHLAASDWRAAVRCTHCHPVPDRVDAPGHIDATRPADVAFSGLAAAAGVTTVWDGAACTVYCHGGAMRFAPRRSPAWTALDGTSCISCHDLPPGAPHPAATDCGRCHLQVADAAGAIVRASLHIDSVVAAPRGAHLVHLGGAGGDDLPCNTCHPDGAYHGPLRDGGTLEATTVCDPCHVPGTYDAAAWREYLPP
jgi:predicted CxxxxCH...CXXCH cytochrome family protein